MRRHWLLLPFLGASLTALSGGADACTGAVSFPGPCRFDQIPAAPQPRGYSPQVNAPGAMVGGIAGAIGGMMGIMGALGSMSNGPAVPTENAPSEPEPSYSPPPVYTPPAYTPSAIQPVSRPPAVELPKNNPWESAGASPAQATGTLGNTDANPWASGEPPKKQTSGDTTSESGNPWADADGGDACDCSTTVSVCTGTLAANGNWLTYRSSASQCSILQGDINGKPYSITFKSGTYTEEWLGQSKPAGLNVQSCRVCKSASGRRNNS